VSILDNIRKGLTGAAGPVVQTDRTQQIEALQQGQTGKAAQPSTGPRTSTVAEQAALAANRAQAAQANLTGEIQASALEQQEEAQQRQYNNQELATIEKALDVKQSFANQSEAIMGNLERQGRELDVRRDGAKLEQLGFNIRLNNKEYIEQLQREGQMSRIDNAAQFEEELKRTIFSDQLDALNESLDMRRLIDADERQFQEGLAQISIDDALAMAGIQQQQFKSQQQAGMLNSLLQTGIKGYEKYDDAQTKKAAAAKKEPSGG
jgi:hypothetical protein